MLAAPGRFLPVIRSFIEYPYLPNWKCFPVLIVEASIIKDAIGKVILLFINIKRIRATKW